MKEEKKKKLVIILIIIAGILLILGIGLFLYVQGKENRKDTKEGKESQTTSETVSEMMREEETQNTPFIGETTTVTFSSEAVNVFSTNAGAEWDDFYSNSVFVGDSVMFGFERYLKGKEGALSNPMFLTFGSYAARIELDYTTAEYQKYLPSYQGKQMHIQDALPLIQPEKVFLFFGLNDIGLAGWEQTVENYKLVIDGIKKVCPDTQIYVISTTYMAKGSEMTKLNNENIRLMNEKIQANATEWGIGFIDIASYMYNSSGGLLPAYSSDGYVHLTNSAYDLWVGVLRDYASKQ